MVHSVTAKLCVQSNPPVNINTWFAFGFKKAAVRSRTDPPPHPTLQILPPLNSVT